MRVATDSRFFRPAEPPEGDATFARLYRAFLAARALVALAVVGALVVGAVVSGAPPGWGLLVSLAYAAAASLHATLPRWQRGTNRHTLAAMNGWRWWGSIGLDLIVIALLQVLEPGSAIPFAALFILPVLMSGVLAPRLASLGAAALATLGMLASVVVSDMLGTDWSGRLTAAGLSGVGYFLVAWLAAELAARLVGEQRAARGSMAFARQQSMLNQLVIDELREGVLVVDRSGQVRAANPAARSLLGETGGGVFGLRGVAAWSDLADAVDASWERSPQGNERADAVLRFDPGPPRHLRMRMRFIRSREADITEDLCLLLLEDRATLVARARQEKLAGMGRMSASIAHEIRNPLSAISQANALLGEDMAADPGAARLVAMVESNVKRLQRIVDEVALLSAPVVGDPPPIETASFAAEVCADWVRTQSDLISPSLRQSLPEGLGAVLFDPDHLRRVLINLLDNAWRHAQQAGVASPWVLVQLEATDAQHQRLLVANPGPLLGPEVERHLFEPFYSTRSRGSGLGLTICRELCERYGARIDYQPQTVDGHAVVAFAITLRRAPRAESAP